MAGSYEQEQAELKLELASISEQISEMDMREKYVRDFMENARTYIEMPKLTPELLRVFIHRIDVYEKEEKYSRTCGNTTMIHYTFTVAQNKTAAVIKTAAEKQEKRKAA